MFEMPLTKETLEEILSKLRFRLTLLFGDRCNITLETGGKHA